MNWSRLALFISGLFFGVAVDHVILAVLGSNAPMEAMQMYLPKITLPTVIIAAAVDGINPCAFTVLLLFIAAILATMQVGEQSLRTIRARMLSLGGIYMDRIA